MSGPSDLLLWVLLPAVPAAAAWYAAQRGAARRRRQLIAGPAQEGSRSRSRLTVRVTRPPRWAVPELLLLPPGLLLGWQLRSPVPALAAAVSIRPLGRLRSAWRARLEEQARESAAIELCTVLAAELRTGAVPGLALETAVAPGTPTAEALTRSGVDTTALLAAARFAGDVPDALRHIAQLRGAAGAAAIAACWQVTADSGAGLAGALDRVAEALRADRSLREAVRGELAGPRTTAVLLAVLPAFGLLLGTALGAHPTRMLLHTAAGLGALAVGLGLEGAGLAWTAAIVRNAEGAA